MEKAYLGQRFVFDQRVFGMDPYSCKWIFREFRIRLYEWLSESFHLPVKDVRQNMEQRCEDTNKMRLR